MVLLAQPVPRNPRTSFFARWLAPGRELLVVGLLLPRGAAPQVVVPLASRRDASPPVVHDPADVRSLFSDLERAFEEPIPPPAGGGDGPPIRLEGGGAVLYEPPDPRVVGTIARSVEELEAMGPEWAVACAVAAALPDAGELDFAVFRSTAKEPGRIARFFGNEASFWVMAIELSPREPERLFFPTRFAAGGAPAELFEGTDSLYCQAPDARFPAVEPRPPLLDIPAPRDPSVGSFVGATSHRREQELLARNARVLHATQHVHCCDLYEPRPNRDRWVSFC